MNKSFTIGVIQMSMDANPDNNTRKACELLEQAASKGVQVACLPEMYRSHYFCQTEEHAKFELAEPIDGPSVEAFKKIAAKNKMVIVAPIFEKRAPGMYHNSAVVLDADGSIADVYRKMHIPDDPLYYEKFYFTPGDLGFKAIQTAYGKIGVLICWDQWFPEAARLTALKGAQVLFYPTAIGWHPAEKAEYGNTQFEAWMGAQRGHSISNTIYVAAANRIGHEGPKDGGIEFWGHSFIYAPFGRELEHASDNKEEILTAVIDPTHMESVRTHWPFFRDRRIDHYGNLLKHFE
jgi:N-carbamoylputrescine amidase